jgi:hypothetical protein
LDKINYCSFLKINFTIVFDPWPQNNKIMIKRIIIMLFFGIALISIVNSQPVVNTGAIYISDGTFLVEGDYTNEGSGNIVFNSSNSPVFSVTGDIINDATGKIITTAGTNGEIIFSGSSTQTLTGTSSADFDFENLTINSGATLNIAAAKNVTVKGTSTITGNFNILSDVTGTGTFIPEGTLSGAGTITMERYMSGNLWHLISSSLPGQSITSFLTANSAIPLHLSERAMTDYDPNNGGWQDYFTNSTSGNLTNGKGFLARTSSNTAVSFTGTPVTSNVSATITDAGTGWNCVGNPFTSSIAISTDADATNNFLSINSSVINDTYEALYLWDEKADYSSKNRNDYIAVNHSSAQDYVQSGQAFLINAATGESSVAFNTNMRQHQNPTFYKKSTSSSVVPEIKLIISDETYEATTDIRFLNDMTLGLDPGYDAGLFGGIQEFNLYSDLIQSNGVKFMVQCLPNDDFESLSVPIGFDYESGGEVEFSAILKALPVGCKVILEDRELEIYTDLSQPEAKYIPNLANATAGTGRFFLHTFDPTTVNTDIDEIQNITTFAFDKTIHIQGKMPVGAVAGIYDMSGRLMKMVELNAGALNLIPAQELKNGIYIVKISGDNLEKVTKLVLE